MLGWTSKRRKIWNQVLEEGRRQSTASRNTRVKDKTVKQNNTEQLQTQHVTLKKDF